MKGHRWEERHNTHSGGGGGGLEGGKEVCLYHADYKTVAATYSKILCKEYDRTGGQGETGLVPFTRNGSKSEGGGKGRADAGPGEGSPSPGFSFLICTVRGVHQTASHFTPSSAQSEDEEGASERGGGKRKPGVRQDWLFRAQLHH